MSDKRQKNQLMLAFTDESRSEAPIVSAEGTESVVAKRGTESLAMGEQLMEEVCERENCKQALARVKANQGSAGVDGMTVNELPEFLKQHWPAIREQLLSGTYKPEPVKRVEIPKPDGGVRKLGIPTVLDRFIQQAVMQVLQRKWDRTFSDHSYGFRPGRSAHQAVAAAQQYIAAGYRWVVDLDLEKFFDRVHHDKLIAKIAERVSDKRLLKLVRAFLRAGVMEGGLVNPVDEGTPQGGPLTPRTQKITSNLSGGCGSGGNRVRIDGCRKRLYVYDRCRARTMPRRPSASIARGSCFGKSINFPVRSSDWQRTVPFRRVKPTATSSTLSN
jgi:RNA-directed DNA polymerase